MALTIEGQILKRLNELDIPLKTLIRITDRKVCLCTGDDDESINNLLQSVIPLVTTDDHVLSVGNHKQFFCISFDWFERGEDDNKNRFMNKTARKFYHQLRDK